MKEIFQQIWELALPYQDKRDDKGHAEIALDYGEMLVGLEKGDEAIVIPAIILHDVGWSQLPRKRRLLIFHKDTTEEEKIPLRLHHQQESVRLAGDILIKVDYPGDLTEKILEIISGHDTRQGFISRDEGLVRDADKLYRFSKTGYETGAARGHLTAQAREEKFEADINKPDYFFSETAKRIASEELELRKKQA